MCVRRTFLRRDIVDLDTVAVAVGQHDLGDAVVADAVRGLAIPLPLRLGEHGARHAQETAILVVYHRLGRRVARHVYAQAVTDAPDNVGCLDILDTCIHTYIRIITCVPFLRTGRDGCSC